MMEAINNDKKNLIDLDASYNSKGEFESSSCHSHSNDDGKEKKDDDHEQHHDDKDHGHHFDDHIDALAH